MTSLHTSQVHAVLRVAVLVYGGVSGEFFWSINNRLSGVFGFSGGPGGGLNLGVSVWMQDTTTYTFPGWVTEYLDWFNPIPRLLNLLGWSTAKAQGVLHAAYAAAIGSDASLLPCYSQGGTVPAVTCPMP